ncbi:MAG TPA: hypothetical protein PLM00_08790 [Spirochaetota bacterium]|nr:hypothetical protein [Spirochaetota bacterium]HPN83476.1 hypothetical protein [Spirochaetota bacterium]
MVFDFEIEYRIDDPQKALFYWPRLTLGSGGDLVFSVNRRDGIHRVSG